MKKAFISLLMLFISNISFSAQLHTFSDIAAALASGQSIHIISDFSQCTSSNKLNALESSLAIFTPNEIQMQNSSITTSFLHFTLNNPFLPNVPINEYVRYTLTSDNNLLISQQDLNAENYTLIGTTLINCKLDTGTKIFSFNN